MQATWKECLPIDQYTACSGSIIQPMDIKVINNLYQPLMGPAACQLYMTIWDEAQENRLSEWQMFTHHHLMVRMNSPLDVLIGERKKLEALGLLKVYKKEGRERGEFVYELLAPLTPARFFSDGLLNIFLYNRVGKREYNRLKKYFITQMPSVQGMKNVTASFADVFTSLNPSELSDHRDLGFDEASDQLLDFSEGAPDLHGTFDFEQLYRLLSDVIISKDAFTDDVKEAVEKLAFVYRLGPEEMGRIIQSAFLHTGVIDIEHLRKAVRDDYQIEHGNALPSLAIRTQPEKYKEFKDGQPKDTYEAQIMFFETVSPFELLESLGGGAKPGQADLKIVEDLMFTQKLPAGVMNVLLDYATRTNDFKLVKGYVEKIAGHWARKGVKTVREAMALAKSEHKKYQEWRSQKKQPRTRVNPRRDQLPKWMTNEAPDVQIAQTQADDRQKWLEDYLNNL